jgi:hypothetical protein
MKKSFLIVLCLNVFYMAAVSQTKDERKIGKVVERLRLAMIDANRSELEELVSEKLSYGHSGGAVDSKTDFVEKIVSGRSDFVTIELADQTISVSGKTALVRHKLNATTNDSGKPGEVHLLVLLVWQKQKGKWKLLARQAVKAG